MKKQSQIFEDSDILDYTDRDGDRRDTGCLILIFTGCGSAIGVVLFLVYLANKGVL